MQDFLNQKAGGQAVATPPSSITGTGVQAAVAAEKEKGVEIRVGLPSGGTVTVSVPKTEKTIGVLKVTELQ